MEVRNLEKSFESVDVSVRLWKFILTVVISPKHGFIIYTTFLPTIKGLCNLKLPSAPCGCIGKIVEIYFIISWYYY